MFILSIYFNTSLNCSSVLTKIFNLISVLFDLSVIEKSFSLNSFFLFSLAIVNLAVNSLLASFSSLIDINDLLSVFTSGTLIYGVFPSLPICSSILSLVVGLLMASSRTVPW